MLTVNQLHEKYKNKDFIEMTHDDYYEIEKWFVNNNYNDDDSGLIKLINNTNRFPIFMKEGIIVRHGHNIVLYLSYCFQDEKTLILTPIFYDIKNQQFRSGKKCIYSVNMFDIENQFADYTENDFLEFEVCKEINYYYIQNIEPEIFEKRKKEYPSDIDLNTFKTLLIVDEIKKQIACVLMVNCYFLLNDKVKLYSKIEQKRQFNKGGSKKNKQKSINPTYRYVVSIPNDYKPQKFDRNYIMSEWGRSGHMREQWVRIENAEVLSERCGGIILHETAKGEYVKIKRPINAAVVHRKIGNPTMIGHKTYAT